ncbi:MAG: UDP-glucose 4-epimerase GalE [Actinobacteria bacterium]|nr:UDP-glucose 4-epimerase GalE [Actinomycetota bacterium]
MTVLVTGGAGYIGSITTRLLSERGFDVVVLDSLELGHRAAVTDVPLVVGNIADRDLVTKTCKEHKITDMVHFAAYKAVGESMADPGKYFDNNVTGAHALISAATDAGVSNFVFSSTASIYGDPDIVPVTEEAEVRCESVYAATKRMTEQILEWYSTTRGLRSVSLRYFNAAGAASDGSLGENWRYSQNLVPHVMKALLGFAPALKVFGNDYPTEDGTGVRDYIHVEDLAESHVSALTYLHNGGDTMMCNVGTGVGTSVMDIITTTERVTGRTVPYDIAPRRAGDPACCYGNPARAKQVLGWSSRRSLDDIIASAYAWHSAHPEGHATQA